MDVWGLTEDTADSWVGPLSRLETLAKADIPILLIAGGADEPVPFSENGGVLVERFRALGGDLTLTVKAGCGHHPHSLYDPAPAVAWAKRVIQP